MPNLEPSTILLTLECMVCDTRGDNYEIERVPGEVDEETGGEIMRIVVQPCGHAYRCNVQIFDVERFYD